jgi:hypothetical protein
VCLSETIVKQMDLFRTDAPELFYTLYPPSKKTASMTLEQRLADDKWYEKLQGDVICHPYDPLTVLCLLEPHLFDPYIIKAATVTSASGATEESSIFHKMIGTHKLPKYASSSSVSSASSTSVAGPAGRKAEPAPELFHGVPQPKRVLDMMSRSINASVLFKSKITNKRRLHQQSEHRHMLNRLNKTWQQEMQKMGLQQTPCSSVEVEVGEVQAGGDLGKLRSSTLNSSNEKSNNLRRFVSPHVGDGTHVTAPPLMKGDRSTDFGSVRTSEF